MGAWGSGLYDNDHAMELVEEVVGGGGLESLEEALRRAVEVGEEYLEAPEGEQALAAADIVSRLRGRNVPADTGVAELAEWLEDVDFFVGKETVRRAGAAVARVMRKPSEVMELWSESGSLDATWAAAVSLLVRRLE